MSSESTRRIAKNTGFLYVRMLLTMGVAFYTSRVVLNALGVEDYGIYNVVGGVVAMFSFLTGMFTSATQRYLNYEMGLGNRKRLNEIFSMSVTLNVMIAILIVLVSEIVGLWFINHKLVIPEDRLMAAHWVFQFSLLAMAVTIISTPYNAVIIAHERMSAFAYIAVVECLLKLGVAIVIVYYGGDKLILYGTLSLVVAFIVRVIYSLYCKRRFEECHYKFYWDKVLFHEMGAFAGWNMYGNFAFVMTTQGVNMLLNMFFGPAVNASRAIAVQIQMAIQGFATNFTMAVDPQIVQSYAQGKKEDIFRLVCYSSKFSFFLLLLLALPVLLETELLLKLWLRQVPDYSVVFVRLVLIQMLIRVLQNPLHTLMHATGKMRKYQLIDGTLLLLNIPVSYWLLKEGGDATVVFMVSIIFIFVAFIALLYVVWSVIGFSVYIFWRKVIWRVLMVSVLLGIMIYVFCFSEFQGAIYWFGEVAILSTSVLLIWNIGMEHNERNLFREYWKVFLKNVHLKSK